MAQAVLLSKCSTWLSGTYTDEPSVLILTVYTFAVRRRCGTSIYRESVRARRQTLGGSFLHGFDGITAVLVLVRVPRLGSPSREGLAGFVPFHSREPRFLSPRESCDLQSGCVASRGAALHRPKGGWEGQHLLALLPSPEFRDGMMRMPYRVLFLMSYWFGETCR